MRGVVGLCGHGFHDDRGWSATYQAGKAPQPQIPVDNVPEVHASLWSCFKEDWMRAPDLWRRLADVAVPMTFVAAGDDIRPSWPLEQLARLIPASRFKTVPGVTHDFWATAPALWVATCTAECEAMAMLGLEGANPEPR